MDLTAGKDRKEFVMARVDELFNHGVECYQRYDYAGSIANFKQLLELDPNYKGGTIKELLAQIQAAKAEHDKKLWAEEQIRKLRRG
ncbi:hypothetical protein AGMMS49928_25030 [Spirochaetia bacterium]|nr:hypothetical protein AGMMS49928_25030 [Spirochaetia bacterium]